MSYYELYLHGWIESLPIKSLLKRLGMESLDRSRVIFIILLNLCKTLIFDEKLMAYCFQVRQGIPRRLKVVFPM